MTPFRRHVSGPVFHRLAEEECVQAKRIQIMVGAQIVLVLYAQRMEIAVRYPVYLHQSN